MKVQIGNGCRGLMLATATSDALRRKVKPMHHSPGRRLQANNILLLVLSERLEKLASRFLGKPFEGVLTRRQRFRHVPHCFGTLTRFLHKLIGQVEQLLVWKPGPCLLAKEGNQKVFQVIPVVNVHLIAP